MLKLIPYNRKAAVEYAHVWAFGRNPAFYDFSNLGGDCTNFASQCLYAGTGIMNFTPELGWFYIDAENRAPAWTGAPFFWNFMTRNIPSSGPFGLSTSVNFVRPGDFVQIKFASNPDVFSHTPIIVSVGYPVNLNNILVAAHSNDADNRPLSSYENVTDLRFLHILGAAMDDSGIDTLGNEL